MTAPEPASVRTWAIRAGLAVASVLWIAFAHVHVMMGKPIDGVPCSRTPDGCVDDYTRTVPFDAEELREEIEANRPPQ